jgi:hypothetical protein
MVDPAKLSPELFLHALLHRRDNGKDPVLHERPAGAIIG